MADIEFDDDVATGTPPLNAAALAGVANWLGALVSLALIAGLGFWGYQLMVRDVTGIPVVRAIEGPMREAPLDPGGTAADHQGLAVNNIAAVGEAEAPADRLVLAPKPTKLTPEDQTAGALAALTQAETPEIAAAASTQTTNSQAEANEVPALDQAALIEATLRSVESGEELVTPQAPASTLGTIEDVIPDTVPGVSKSLRPSLRPALPAGVALAAASPTAGGAANGDAVRSISPADIPVGTRLAQLGAFESEAIAIAQWATISAQFDDYMSDKVRVIQKAQSGGNVFYRLRAHGFTDLSDARRFCSALLAKQANCIPVVTR